MASSTTTDPSMLADFRSHLQKSRRICALLGAGLSASSGLPTFRGAGGLWRTHDATVLATPQAFRADPSLVWHFYSYRRHMALNAKPNAAHHALAQLAKHKPQFITLSQNVDGLSTRAGHPPEQLKLLHGSLYDLKCTDQRKCGYKESNNYTDPIVPSLVIPQGGDVAASDETTTDSSSQIDHTKNLIHGLDISDIKHDIPTIQTSDLPQCPSCQKALLRPGVVWFGESLPEDVMADVDAFFSSAEPIDLMLVVGTSAVVYPAAGYIQFAKHKGARVAVVNPDPSSGNSLDLGPGGKDWFFMEDAAKILPEMLRPVIGDIEGSQ
ncbi:hypothetical protein LTR64_003133 [Lithohypha guttulata]|uniref:uncharacterized protein n=1 Tax=Lithohypha guttulata TaxID=1690604 RepID=UPI002DDE5143|nr:hypothetical protein LTR51_000644 [Lithohypha guttulata]